MRYAGGQAGDWVRRHAKRVLRILPKETRSGFSPRCARVAFRFRSRRRKTQSMSIKAGVWIDHRQAIVVLVTDTRSETTKIPSDIGSSGRPAGSSRSKEKRYTASDFVAEDKLERKLDSQLKTYYDEVIAYIRGAEAILIIGPGEAKGQFLKRLKSKKLRGRIIELETSDKMTDRQIAAKVGQHFATTAGSESITPQTAAKATPRQRTKKSGK